MHLDSHTDLWDTYNGLPYSHGTMFRRAIIEGILDPARVIQAGMRGSLYGEDDENIPSELGVETIPWIDLAELSPGSSRSGRGCRVGDGPAFLSLDVDFVDAAFCPGTGTPEVAGPTSFQAHAVPRALSPASNSSATTSSRSPRSTTGRARSTALFASGAIFEMLSMIARRRRTRLEGIGATAGAERQG